MSQYAVSAPKTPTSTRLCLPTISFEFIIDQQRLNSIFRHLPQAPKNRLAHTAKSLCVRRLLYPYIVVCASRSFLYRNFRCGFHVSDNKHTIQTSQAMHLAQSVQHKVLICLHVARMHLYKKIKIATCIVAIRYFLNILHSIHKFLDIVMRMLLQTNIAPIMMLFPTLRESTKATYFLIYPSRSKRF